MSPPTDASSPGRRARYQVVRRGALRALVLRGHEAHLDRLAALHEPGPDAERVAGGRAPHPVLTLEGGERVVVRRYRRGGALRHLNRETYFLGHRAFREVRVTLAAARAGVRVPLAIAGLEWRGRLGYTAALVTRYIEVARELASWLPAADPEARAAVLFAVGEQIGRMHAGGVAHPDLNLRNFLVSAGSDGGPLVHIIDFDRGTTFSHPVPAGRAARDLRRLRRSALKLRAPVPPGGWEALRSGYGAGWPSDLDLG